MTMTRTRERGELEGQVMLLLWENEGTLSARELQARFSEPVPAYTTLMTALTRLEKKGRVVRSGPSPRKLRFAATRSDDQHAGDSMRTALDKAGDRQAALLSFAGNLSSDDVALLRKAFGEDSAPSRP
ncbi:2'-5' RNA ligase [Pseudoclavibacter sp. RFBJ3]|nr:2'-5' RNA ligase [Pseudoclavibacter sp. RFBJ5]PPF90397.1 2'-5' RNA ligase [Pseudoclavibacter sp. RFBJ3]PPG01082.1 2'-5' RNA ligase [Pseudoclavibacter sp. RFBH5]PPG26185.1 2'-5' RNA ligase [Pseudoclavibacter sp. RFBI4]